MGVSPSRHGVFVVRLFKMRYSLFVIAVAGCVAAPAPPPPATPDPGAPILVMTSEEATAREAARSQATSSEERRRADQLMADQTAKEKARHDAELQRARENTEARRSGPSRQGFWNPAKGEHPVQTIVPPPARRCRTIPSQNADDPRPLEQCEP